MASTTPDGNESKSRAAVSLSRVSEHNPFGPEAVGLIESLVLGEVCGRDG